jgi:ADP-ribosylglycohydrolase
MGAEARVSFEQEAMRRARMRGALLGGAVGDALGNPVEFRRLPEIRERYGPEGVTGLVPDDGGAVGLVTDDTQMTLFTVEGLIRGRGKDPLPAVRDAYLRWLDTQNHWGPPPPLAPYRSGWLREQTWLYARRAPGNACLSGLQIENAAAGMSIHGEPGPVNSDSKGCGAVMRSAPFGLVAPAEKAFEDAARCAQITHGHPTGYLAAGALAAIVAYEMHGLPIPAAVAAALQHPHDVGEETAGALRAATRLAQEGDPTAEKVESLGGGWVAEEALAIAVYCALVHPGDIRAALLLAVNHSGDSDSTGAICGNILGAWHGDAALPVDWLIQVEGRAAIAELADDLAAPTPPDSLAWQTRYPPA